MHGCDLSHFNFLLRHSRHDVIMRFLRRTRGAAGAGTGVSRILVAALKELVSDCGLPWLPASWTKRKGCPARFIFRDSTV